MSKILDVITNSKVVLTEGGMVERIRRHLQICLDPHLAHAHLVYDDEGRQILSDIYNEYISIGQQYNVPFLSLAATWRANPERVQRSAYKSCSQINNDCVQLLKDIRSNYGQYAASIFICGMMGCRGDAYLPEEALPAAEAAVFHREQAQALVTAGVDCIKVATLPALSEALGLAITIAELDVPYILSFVIRPDGNLLDGTPLHRAIDEIDSTAKYPPVFYMINCVHPTIFTQAFCADINDSDLVRNRVWGFQANTSALSPEELENLDHLDTTEPGEYADLMANIHRNYGIRILGGCCGSDARHIKEIAARVC